MEVFLEKSLKATAVILRTFNNKFIEKQVRNLLDIGIGKIIIVTNAKQDKGSTRGYLGNIMHDRRIQMIEMFEGYTWTSALNAGLAAIQMDNAEAEINGKNIFRFILNISVEANIKKIHLEKMLAAAIDDPQTAVVGTSFKGTQNNNIVSLGRSYRHPRNTCMLLKIEAFGPFFAGFNPMCDDCGGMEDIEFILHVRAVSNLGVAHLDLQIPLVVGVHYDQKTKEEREQAAMDIFIKWWRSRFADDSFQRRRIEAVITEMGIES